MPSEVSKSRPSSTEENCPTCGFPPKEPGFLRLDVPVGMEGWGKALPCPTCNAEKMGGRLRSELKGQLKDHTFDNYVVSQDRHQRTAYQAAVKFAASPVGFLTLYGANGAGKSHLLAAIANELGPGRARYFSLPDLVAGLRQEVGEGDPEKVLQRYASLPVLILDEIDKAALLDKAGRPTWCYEQVFRLIENRYRYLNERGTVLASNLTPVELSDHFSYLVSRAEDERCSLVYIGNQDNRSIAGRLKKMVGLKGYL